MSLICYEWTVFVRVCDVVRLTVTELSEYKYHVAQLAYNAQDLLP